MSVRNSNIRSHLMVLLFPLLLAACGVFPESIFKLAPESRLPKWFTQPAGMNRSDLSVTLDYYIGPRGRKAVLKLYDKNGTRLKKVSGKQLGLHPLTFTPHVMGQPLPRPSYEVVTVDGVVDIVEHRKMEPIFYMTDDSAVWEKWAPDANRSNPK